MIQTSRSGSIAVITIDRHASRNSVNEEVCRALREAFEEFAATVDTESPVRVIMLTGAGTAFSAGADLSGGVYSEAFYAEHERLLLTMESIPVPVVAAINGPAVGAGVQLALAADLRVMDPGAFLAVPVVKVGLALDWWTVQRACAIVGGGHARSLLYAAQPIDAETAARIGFANHIGDAEAALEYCRQLASFAPLTLRHIKSVINDDLATSEPDPKHKELQTQAWYSEDAAEARTARAEKRAPQFRGR